MNGQEEVREPFPKLDNLDVLEQSNIREFIIVIRNVCHCNVNYLHNRRKKNKREAELKGISVKNVSIDFLKQNIR